MNENPQGFWTPLKIILVYILFGCLWILLSDSLLALLTIDAVTMTQIQTYKGWFYVFVTAGLLYGLIKKTVVRIQKSEQAQVAIGKKYSELIENAHDFIFTVDLRGNFKSINKAGEEITGYKRDEFSSLNLTDIVDSSALEYIRIMFADSQVIESFPSIEIYIRRKDNQKVLLEVKNKLVRENGKPVLIQGIGRDITQRKHNEDQLKERETQLRDLVETANEGIWTVDGEGYVTFVNKKLAEMLGYETDEMIGKSFLDFMDEDAQIEGLSNLNRRRSGVSEQLDFRFKKRDETELWVIASTSPIFNDGEFAGALAMMTDITERRRDEEEKARLAVELIRRKSRLDNIISSIPGIVWENEFNADSTVQNTIFVSDYVEKMVGYSADEWRKNVDFWHTIVHEDDRENAMRESGEFFQNPEVKEAIQNYRWHTKDGRVIFVETRMLIERNAQGKPTAVRGVTIDVTEHHEAEEKLRLSEERYRALASGAHVVWLADAAGMIDEMPLWCELTGQTAEEVRGFGWLDAVHRDDQRIIIKNWEKALKTNGVFDAEYRVRLKNGEYSYHHGRGVPIFNDDGTLREWIGTCLDISSRKVAEKLSRENEARYLAIASSAAFFWTADVSGNINTPTVNLAGAPEIKESEIKTGSLWWLENVHPEERESTAEKWKHCIETRSAYEIENRIRMEDGSYRHIYTRSVPVFRQNNEVREWVGIGFDITERIKIEQKLAEKEKNLEFALKAGKLGVWHIDLSGNSMTYSDGLLENFGIPENGEFSIQQLAKMIHPDDRELHRQAVVKTIKKGEDFQCQYRIIIPSGEIRWVDSRGEVIYGKDGRAVSISGTAQNITENKLAQEALRESEDRLNAVIDNLTEGLIISDEDGNLLHWNRASLELHGFADEQEDHQTLLELNKIFDLITLDGEILNFEDWVMPRISRGETLRNIELIVRRKDIEWERVFSYGGAKVKDASGRNIIFLTLTDVTDKKRAEAQLKQLNEELEQRVVGRTKELRESEERMRFVGNYGTDGFWDRNLLTGEIYVSRSFKKLFGYEDEETPRLSSFWADIVVPEDLERAHQAYLEHTLEKKPYNVQIRYIHKDGSVVWVNCRGVALKDETGKFVRMVGTHINITQQKIAEESLYKLNSQLEQRVLDKTREVRQSEAHFRQLSEGLPLLVWTGRGQDGSCDYLSPQWLEYTGIAEDLQLGFDWIEQVHPEDRESTINLWKSEAAKGEPHEDEFRLRRYDGTYRWFQMRALPLKGADGRVVKWFGTNIDIDDHKLSEQSMLLLQDLSVKISQAETLESALDEVLTKVRNLMGWEIGEVWLPNETKEVLQLAQTSFIDEEEIRAYCEDCHKNTFAPGKGVVGTVWESKQFLWAKDVATDARFMRKEEAVKCGIKTAIIIPILSLDKVIAIFAFFSRKLKPEDERGVNLVTAVASQLGEFFQRKIAEKALKQSQAGLQLGISVARLALIEIDFHTGLVSLSREASELFGFPPAQTQITREQLRSLTYSEDRERMLKIVGQALDPNGERLFEAEHRIVRQNGEVRWVSVKEQVFFENDELGNPIPQKAILVCLDVTKNKQMEVELRENEERFRTLFEESPAGNVIIDLETKQFIDCNSIAAETLGYTKEELKRLKIADLEVKRTPEESEFITQTVISGNKIQYETINRTKSGELKDLLVVSTGMSVDGKPYSYSSFLDITEMKRSGLELQKERERFEKIAAVSPSVIYSFRVSPQLVSSFPFANQAIYEIYNKTPEELKDDVSAAFDLIPAEDYLKVKDSIEESAKTMLPWHEIWRVNHPVKGEIWVEGHSAPIRDDDGGITWHGVLIDVTERKSQENELAERERLITAIFNTAPSLIALWDMSSGKISYVNDTSAQVLGFTPEEIYAMEKDELFGRIHPADLLNVRAFIDKLLQARDGEVLSHEYRFRNRAGEWRIIQSQDTIFERSKNGKVLKTLNIIDDVTDRRLSERALRESEERFVKAFEANPAAVTFTRLSDGVVIDVNKSYEKIFGYSSKAVIGQTAARINMLSEPLETEAFLKQLRENGTKKNIEASLRTKSGQLIDALISNELIELNGELCVLSIIYDITDRKRAEEDLRRTEEKLIQSQKLESVGRLAGGIAHDFNNMLTAINGYSDLTLKQLDVRSPFRHNLEEIRKAGQRSAELTQQLLAFSRKQVLKPQTLDLNSVVNETGTLLKRLIGEDVSLVTILKPGLKKVNVDPAQLSQVIVNLSINSRDAMPKGGTLSIETMSVVLDEYYGESLVGAKAGEYVLLAVSDTGSGMSEEQKEHIFEPFYTTKEVGKGTGLGLATVYGFVKQSEGYIWVYSEPENGTCFKIYLPAIQEETVKPMDAINREQEFTGSETILLVEDEELVRNLNREILEAYGYKVIEAHNGLEALKICERGEIKIDMLMTDVVMPEMGGRELAENLAVSHPHLKVLFTSGYTDDAVVRHGVIDEGTNFLQKPFSLDALLTKLRDVLDAR